MKAFILAAGFGNRLKPITDKIPKPLIPILNVQAICYSVMLIKEAGIQDVVCNLHYRAGEIINFFKKYNFFGLNIEFSIEEEILGTGGGIKKCQDLLYNDDFIIINSDIITDINLADLIREYYDSPALGLLCLQNKKGKDLTVAVEGKRVVDVRNFLKTDKTPEYDYMGVAIVSPTIFKYLKLEFSSVVYTGFTSLIQHKALGYHVHDGIWEDIGSMESYIKANVNLIEDITLKQKLFRHTGLVPNIVSSKAKIEHGVSIKKSIIGDDCHIGRGAVIEESVVLPGTFVNYDEVVINNVLYNK